VWRERSSRVLAAPPGHSEVDPVDRPDQKLQRSPVQHQDPVGPRPRRVVGPISSRSVLNGLHHVYPRPAGDAARGRPELSRCGAHEQARDRAKVVAPQAALSPRPPWSN
jgi:hypothetical protein